MAACDTSTALPMLHLAAAANFTLSQQDPLPIYPVQPAGWVDVYTAGSSNSPHLQLFSGTLPYVDIRQHSTAHKAFALQSPFHVRCCFQATRWGSAVHAD